MQLLFSETESIVWVFYSYALSKEQINHTPSFYMITELQIIRGPEKSILTVPIQTWILWHWDS